VRAPVAVSGALAPQEASPQQEPELRVLPQQAERIVAQPGLWEARQQVRLEPPSRERLGAQLSVLVPPDVRDQDAPEPREKPERALAATRVA
jgi:hypothetical protein